MDAVRAWLQQLQFGGVVDTLLVVAASLLCITFHETAHGFVAWKLGDPTAKNAGRLTLNPIRHVDVMGLVMMAVFHFGWAKPVPVNMYRLRHPKRDMALVAAAGPLSNLLLAFAAMLVQSVVIYFYYRSALNGMSQAGFKAWEYLIMFLEYVSILSVGLAVFNVIPIPPLDGSKVLFALLPEAAYRKLMRYERYGMLLLVVVMLLGVLDTPLSAARDWVTFGLERITRFPYDALNHWFPLVWEASQ